ncbi:MAG: methyltransferase [Alphaproteobacteria bacterium]|nr:methyltransferase [Alphaproteobacteria bacterium]
MTTPHQADVSDASTPETSESGWLGGRLRLKQPRKGYRAGLDAALLAAACDASPGARLVELGCGVGAVLIAVASRREGVMCLGVERDPSAVVLARDNAQINGLSDRIEIVQANIAEAPAGLGQGRFDAALANPPYFDDPTALRGPAAAKRGAWMAEDGLDAWTDALTRLVRDRGVITVIHRADRLADLLAGLGRRAGSFAIRPIHPHAEAPAKRVLVQAVKGGRAPLVLLPPLILHPGAGAAKHTPQTEAILRGEAALGWA